MQLNGYIIEHQSDLSGANLSGLEIVNADITQATLAGANLAGSKIVNVQSRGASFERANLVGADLVGEDLEGVDFGNSDLTDADLSEANLRGANFSHSKIVRTKFRHANLAGACFDWCHITRSDFSYAEFHGHVELSEDQLVKRGYEITPSKELTDKHEWYEFLPSSGRTRAQRNWENALVEDRAWEGAVSYYGSPLRYNRFTGANFGCGCTTKLGWNHNYDDGISCSIGSIRRTRLCDFSKANLSQIEVYDAIGDKYHHANFQGAIINFSSGELRIGDTFRPSPSTKSTAKGRYYAANFQDATLVGLVVSATTKNLSRFRGVNIGGTKFKDSYLVNTNQKHEIESTIPLSDFSEPQIRQILGC